MCQLFDYLSIEGFVLCCTHHLPCDHELNLWRWMLKVQSVAMNSSVYVCDVN